MGVFPRSYNKEKFIEYLEKNKVSNDIIIKFKELPETLVHKNSTYKLNIITTWFSIGNTYYNFELNYYSEDLIEFLFSYKIFTDIEKSINYLLTELINNNYIKN